MNFLLELLRLFHKVIGITPAPPEHERAYLYLWIGVAVAIAILGTLCFLFLLPKIIH